MVFQAIHIALNDGARPAARLKALLATYNAEYRVDGQQRAGKAALAIMLWRRQKGRPSLLQ